MLNYKNYFCSDLLPHNSVVRLICQPKPQLQYVYGVIRNTKTTRMCLRQNLVDTRNADNCDIGCTIKNVNIKCARIQNWSDLKKPPSQRVQGSVKWVTGGCPMDPMGVPRITCGDSIFERFNQR